MRPATAAEWCVLLRTLGSGEREGPPALVGVIGLVKAGSADTPPMFSLQKKNKRRSEELVRTQPRNHATYTHQHVCTTQWRVRKASQAFFAVS